MDQMVSIVTGAGSGIGAECARLLASRGHSVVLAGRTRATLDAVRATLEGDARHLVVVADIADSARADEVVDRTIAEFGRVDALVLAAGVAPLAPIGATTGAHLEEAFFVNTFGPAHLILRAWPHFAARRSGRVVIVSSMASFDPFPGFFAYAASKAAVDSFARSIKVEGRAIGVKGFAVNPGAVETAMLRKNFPASMLPSSRTLSPKAVAEVVVACACGERDADNGKAIAVASP